MEKRAYNNNCKKDTEQMKGECKMATLIFRIALIIIVGGGTKLYEIMEERKHAKAVKAFEEKFGKTALPASYYIEK